MKFLRIAYFILETIILLPIKLLAVIWWLICGVIFIVADLGTWREWWRDTIINNEKIIKSMNWIKTGRYEMIES